MDLGSVPGHLESNNAVSDEPSIQLYSKENLWGRILLPPGQKILEPCLNDPHKLFVDLLNCTG